MSLFWFSGNFFASFLISTECPHAAELQVEFYFRASTSFDKLVKQQNRDLHHTLRTVALRALWLNMHRCNPFVDRSGRSEQDPRGAGTALGPMARRTLFYVRYLQ